MSDVETGNGKDLAFERTQLRRRLSELAPKERLEALLAASDARELVQSLPADELYSTIAEVGLADSTELVHLASPEQFQAFLDLGAWSKDRIEPRRAITWLRAARVDDPHEFLAKVRSLDVEVLELVLQSATVVHDRETEPDFNPEGVSVETPDGKYLVEFTVEGAELSTMRALVSGLIAEDPFRASRLFETIRWELPSEIEETAYQLRQARLGDLGFPTLEQASAIFTFVEPGPAESEAVVGAQGLAAPRPDYLLSAFRGLSYDERGQCEEQLRYLANCVLVAESAEPGDPVMGRRGAEMVRDYLALGFEHLGANTADTSALVRRVGLRRIFQIGFSLTLKLKFRADRIARHPLARLDGVYLLFPQEEQVLSALRRRRPMRALRVEGTEPVLFRSASELREAQSALDRAEQQVALLAALLGETAAAAREAVERFGIPLRQLGVERLFAAIAANALLDSALNVGPVDGDRLGALLEKLIASAASAPQASAGAIEHVSSVLNPCVPPEAAGELKRQTEATLSALAGDLGPAYVRGRPIEPQALVNLPVRGQSRL
jgi:hypothetical protein